MNMKMKMKIILIHLCVFVNTRKTRTFASSPMPRLSLQMSLSLENELVGSEFRGKGLKALPEPRILTDEEFPEPIDCVSLSSHPSVSQQL